MGFERQQFTFYRSFLRAAEQLPPKKQRDFLLAIIQYALDEIEPEITDSTVRIGFEAIRPILDKARRKAQAGKTGGEVSGESRSKPEANRKQIKANRSKPKPETDTETDTGTGTGAYIIASPERESDETFSEVFDKLAFYGVFMSDKDNLDCEELCAEYGSRAVIQAIQRAKEQNAPRWSYIRAIITSGGVSSAGAKRPGYQRHEDGVSPAMADWIRRSYEDNPEYADQQEDQNDREGGTDDAKED